jgi:hypothetical protein
MSGKYGEPWSTFDEYKSTPQLGKLQHERARACVNALDGYNPAKLWDFFNMIDNARYAGDQHDLKDIVAAYDKLKEKS